MPERRYGVESFARRGRGKFNMPRRTAAWISASLSTEPSKRKKASSSRIPAGIDQPRVDAALHGKQMTETPLRSRISDAFTSSTSPARSGDPVK